MKAQTGQTITHLLGALKTVGVLALVLGAIALGLYILDLVPPVLAPEPERAYATVEEARRSTGLPVYLPTYFPEYLRWPPHEVRGRVAPGPRVFITVALRETGSPVLWLEEWLSSSKQTPPDLPDTARITVKETVAMQGGVPIEVVGYTDLRSQLFYRLVWDQEDVRVSLTASLPREELLRMARNMYSLPGF